MNDNISQKDTTPILSVHNLQKQFNDLKVLKGVEIGDLCRGFLCRSGLPLMMK